MGPFSFGDYVLDVRARRLLRSGREVLLSRQVFELLALLVEEAPRALSKAEMMSRLWPAASVSDGALFRLISDLRKTLGGEAHRQTFVRTIHRFGYALAVHVATESEVDPSVRLPTLQHGDVVRIGDYELTVRIVPSDGR
jgi:DNA-binding winged helix-turn-helix (wHTH) protein